MYTQGERIATRYIEDEIKDSYINYAMSVIVGRALPDVRDGLKPVQRRILYTMNDLALQHSKPYKKSARIVGECFVEGTLILTETGLVPIQSIVRGDMAYTQKGLSTVTELYEMPAKPLLKVMLDNGTYNIVTPSQKFKVLGKDLNFVWKEAKDLSDCDYIVLKAGYPDIQRTVKLEKDENELCPAYLDEDVAYLLGFFMATGCVAKERHKIDSYRIGLSSNSRQAIEKIADILIRKFDYVADLSERAYLIKAKHTTCVTCIYTIGICKNYIVDFLKLNFNLGDLKTPTKTIPMQIFNSPKSVIFSFISGLVDGNGAIHMNSTIIHYNSTSEALIDRLQILLQHCGVFGTKYVSKSAEGGEVVDEQQISTRCKFYNLEFKGSNARLLASGLKLSNPQKQAALYEMQSRVLEKPNHEVIEEPGCFSTLILKEPSECQREACYPTGDTLLLSRVSKNLSGSILGETIDKDIYFLRVLLVEQAPSEKTYDIQVEGEHEFIANGMISHNCLGKYHPHGDTAVYDALVRMVQDFSLRYPLVDGQGNWGSVDGDAAAAMRYTEAKMAKIADEMLADIDKETVDFVPNFDDSLQEPTILPAVLPNLLVNGCSGIAVGMATNIPPHNLSEIADGIVKLIDEPEVEIKDLMRIVKGPDFPTGATICGREGIRQAYTTGRGIIKIHARAQIEEQKGGKECIVITEIPYQTNKTNLIESIANLINEKKIEGISNIRDESDKEGIRIVIELKREKPAQVILNQLYKHTQLQSTFGIIMLALVNNQPRVLNLRQLFDLYIEHRKEIIIKRTSFDLKKAQERAHILEGLKIALKHIERIIKTIREAKDPKIAKEVLVKNFDLSEKQAQAILEMQLQRLTALERSKIEEEYLDLIKKIELYESILASERKVLEIIKNELTEVKKKYGDERRTDIVGEIEDLKVEDLIAEEDVVITISHSGYIKRLPVSAYRRQRRGGKGVVGAELKEDDFIEHLFIATTHEYILFITNKGRVYWVKVHEIPQASRVSKGKAIVNLLALSSGEAISAFVPVKEFDKGGYLVMATQNGLIKKTELSAYSNPRKGGIIGITLKQDDSLIDVALTNGSEDVILATREGNAIRFKEKQVRDMGRSAKGVKAINLGKKDKVIGMVVARKDATLLTVSEKGFGKRTPIEEYRLQSRGGKGIINVKMTEKTGLAVGIKMVTDKDEVMIITEGGVIVRSPVKDIRTTGRSTQGVKVITLKDQKDKVSAVAPVVA